MKQTITAIMFLLLVSSCSDDNGILSPGNKNNYREIAYNSLSQQSKETIIIDWKVGLVKQGVYKKEQEYGSHILELTSGAKIYFFTEVGTKYLYDEYKLVAVSFKTKHDALLGPITIIVDPYLEIAIGSVGRL